MRTANALIFADIMWPDGVELPEQVMRDLCPHVAMHIAEFFAEVCDEYPQLLEGKVKVNWGAPTTPDHLIEQLRQEGHMEASPKTFAVYTYPVGQASNEQCHIYGFDTSGAPLTDETATELGSRLADATTGVMVLPVENEPALAGASAEEREAAESQDGVSEGQA